MVTGDLIIYRTQKHGARPAVFVAYVGGRVRIRIRGRERLVNASNVEAL